MKSRWSDKKLRAFVDRYAPKYGEALAIRAYSSQLLGSDPELVLHGGGNTSVKEPFENILKESIPAVHVKGSGWDMATTGPEGFVPLDLGKLLSLERLDSLDDTAMFGQFALAKLLPVSFNPSIEALAHAWIGKKYVDHTHANAILTLTNRVDGVSVVQEALGEDVVVRPYLHPGFALSKDLSEAVKDHPRARGVVLLKHGLFTFADDPKISYETHIELVDRAETYIRKKSSRTFFDLSTASSPPPFVSDLIPFVRGLLAEKTDTPDRPYRPVVLSLIRDQELLKIISHPEARKFVGGPVLTADFLIRTKPWIAFVEDPDVKNLDRLKEQIRETVQAFIGRYTDYHERGIRRTGRSHPMFNPAPRILALPGLGVFCSGPTLKEARITADLARVTLKVKSRIAAMNGTYKGIDEDELFEMEYWAPQLAKLSKKRGALAGKIAVVTGAAGAIGSAICRRLLEEGCCVAGTDLPGERLEALREELSAEFGDHYGSGHGCHRRGERAKGV